MKVILSEPDEGYSERHLMKVIKRQIILKPNNFKSLGQRKSQDLDRITKIRHGHLCLRDEYLGF
jgi:hypothetical protein